MAPESSLAQPAPAQRLLEAGSGSGSTRLGPGLRLIPAPLARHSVGPQAGCGGAQPAGRRACVELADWLRRLSAGREAPSGGSRSPCDVRHQPGVQTRGPGGRAALLARSGAAHAQGPGRRREHAAVWWGGAGLGIRQPAAAQGAAEPRFCLCRMRGAMCCCGTVRLGRSCRRVHRVAQADPAHAQARCTAAWRCPTMTARRCCSCWHCSATLWPP